MIQLFVQIVFQAKKKELQQKQTMDQGLLNKLGINIKLVEENTDDVKLAQLLMQNKSRGL